jgi:hypothetical protein
MVAKRIVQQPVASLPSGYAELLEDLKARIRQARCARHCRSIANWYCSIGT